MSNKAECPACKAWLSGVYDAMEGGPYEDRRHEHAWSIVKSGKPVRALDEWIHRDVPGLARKRLTGSVLQPSLFEAS